MSSERSKASREELTRTKEAFREFVSLAVHDLREPLRAIGSSADMLSSVCGDGVNERATRCLRYIREGVERMDMLLKDIADYWYGEGRELQPAETKMEDALVEAQRQIAHELRKNEAILTHDALPTVTGDFFGLATVFRNLIENACKFRSAAPPVIHVACREQGGEWVFSVRDNGMGFDPVYANSTFQPFQRLHGKRGSGLGLAVAKRIVERHGGRIWADSAPGEGSTFWFSLPAPDREVPGPAGRAS
ncbi:MAG: hypothetical protein DMG59_23750 [Acidobacteria bacterium]|nr:MAG: hypothetical protein DMG59_23750 [Acidobacteriota bacterium]